MQLFDSYIDAGQKLPQKDKERYYTALVEFAAYGKEPQLTGAALAVFTAIQPSIELSRKRSESGQKGASKRLANSGFASKQTANLPASKTGAKNGFASAELSEANSNSNSKEKEKEKESQAKPKQTAPCPKCGSESEHVSGNMYRCPNCDEFGAVWELTC